MKSKNALIVMRTCQSMSEMLKFLVDNCPSGYLLYLKNPKKFGVVDLCKWIESQTLKLMDPVYSWQTKVYWVLNGITEFPRCQICNDPLVGCNVKSAQKGYEPLICQKKSCKNKLKYIRQSATMMVNHGYSNNFANPEVVQKLKERNIATYGNACPANNKDIRHAIEQQNLETYGVKHYSSTQECKDKVKSTNLKNLGVEYPMQSDICKKKFKKTCLDNYGVDHPSKSKELQDAKSKRLQELYGPNYKQVLWGKPNISQMKRSYLHFISKSKVVNPCFTLEQFIECRLTGVEDFEFECKRCGKKFMSNWDNGIARPCPYCANSGISKAESTLHDFVASLVGEVNTYHNDRHLLSPLELDVFIPSKKLAIEYDGLYWHNDEQQPNHKYHLMKTELCEAKGVRLIHIFENEWLFKHSIVESRLKDLLGMPSNTVFARKCSVEEIENGSSMNFQEANHLQGAVNAKVNLGLYFKDELVSLMTFGKPRFDKKHEWELLRFCNKLGYHIPGAASKLLKHFERNWHPKSIVSYADRRWSQGKLYEALGFKLDHVSAPNYWYFNDYKTMELQSRIKFQKHNLSTLLSNFDPSKSEVENMKSNGYHRIFDCGNLVYVKLYEKMRKIDHIPSGCDRVHL